MDNAQTLFAMPGVGFIGMLIIGILAGWIAEKVTASDHGLLTNLLVGIAGSFVVDRRDSRAVDLAEHQRAGHDLSVRSEQPS
jgi:F0F1-type ATP synthase assembly protein I